MEIETPTPKRRLIDLSHTVEADMLTYPGLPGPLICDFLSREKSHEIYAEGTEFQIGKIEMVGNTGTYVDSPFHRFADGKDLSELPLERLANLDCIVVDATVRKERAVEVKYFAGLELEGKAILVRTGWDTHWRTDAYFTGHPFLSAESATFLKEARAVFVGIDSLNIDCTDDGLRPVHTTLLGAGIPIGEHLCNLGALPSSGFRFFAVPPKVAKFGTFPVRAFALV
jgi:kynurenine formamidase